MNQADAGKEKGRKELRRFIEFWDGLSRRINIGVEYSLFGMGLAMSIIVGVQVFSRYALNYSLFWSEELARYLLVWLTFLGASAAYRRRVHPGIDVLVKRMPDGMAKASAILVHLISIGLFTVMIVFGIRFAHFVRFQISPALYLPKWFLFSVIPASGLILTIHALAFMLNDIRGEGKEEANGG